MISGTATAVAGPARRAPWVALRRAGLAALCGCLAASALPPLGVVPGLLGFTGLFLLLRTTGNPSGAFLMGWTFGLGWFGIGLYWVAIAFYTDAERFGALAVPAVILLVMSCALFAGLAAALPALRRWRSLEAHALAWAAAWALTEALRGSWGIQFPWNPVGLAWSDMLPMLQWTAWIGTPGLSFVTIFLAGLGAGAFTGRTRARRGTALLTLTLLVAMAGAGWARLAWTSAPGDTAIQLRIVQANILQHHKWDPELRAAWFRRHLDMSGAPREPRPNAIIWPESAVPFQIAREPLVREFIGQAAPPGGYVLTGGDRFDLDQDPPLANNSLWALDETGQARARYDKVDLVPFGEFLPFRPVLQRLGLEKLTAGSFDFQPGQGRATISLPGLPPFSPLICYEAIYPGRAVAQGEPRPTWLLNITNDAWFGASSGPYQHLAMARTRAVEEGLPLVRAANTGISVVTDAFGRVRQRLDLGRMGTLDMTLPGALEKPPLYARTQGMITAGLIAGALMLAFLLDRQMTGRLPKD